MAKSQTAITARALVRFNTQLMGFLFGFLGSAALFVVTLALVIYGGDEPGPFLGQLRYFFPGYSVTLGGAFIGALWGGGAGYALGRVLGLAYGSWMFKSTTQALERLSDSELENALQPRVVLLDAKSFGLMSGGLLALGLVVSTSWLWFTTGHWSPHLALLSNYLPGYEPTFTGSLVGAIWIFVYGTLAAGAVAWIYDRVVVMRTSARD